MTAHLLHRHDLGHSAMLDLLLILSGALCAWLFWPANFH